MAPLLAGLLATVLALFIGLAVNRRRKRSAAEEVWSDLAATCGPQGVFDPSELDGLPLAARRYLRHAIEPGTPLAGPVRLVIDGAIRLRAGAEPSPMTSEELLAPPRGYVWRARVETGPLSLRGHDLYVEGRAEMRWWLGGLVPVVRSGGPELARSAVGRMLGESFLLPSSLLPSSGARWRPLDDSRAVAELEADGETVELTVQMDEAGRLQKLSFPRWNADPKNGPVGYLPFVSEGFEEERTFGGFTVPTRLHAGWRLGEPEGFAFYFARIREAEYHVDRR